MQYGSTYLYSIGLSIVCHKHVLQFFDTTVFFTGASSHKIDISHVNEQ